MTNKSFAKLLSVILTLAICATTVFGCLMTANAQNGPSYVVSETQLVKGATNGSVDATFTIASGMAAGFFTVDNPNNWYTAVTASVKNATPVEGAYSADDFVIEISKESSAARVLFKTAGEKLYSTVVLTLNFTLANGIEDDIAVTLSDLDFSDLYENYSDFNAKNGKFLAGCTHKYTVSGTPVYTDDENKYAVYSDAVCALCGESKSGYQVKPVAASGTINAVSWNGQHDKELSLLDPSAANSESNPFIISTPGQLYSLQNGNATYGGAALDTAGKYFKVADGIDAFYINGGETVANLTSAEAVKNYFEASDGSKWWSNYNAPFKGHFDGNGVTIYGLRSDNGNPGLFPYVNGDASFKNVTVKNSYLISNATADPFGAIVGVARGATTSLVIENCTVANNFLKFNNPAKDIGTGALAGYCYAGSINVNNCIVYGNIYDNSAYTGTKTLRTGLISYSSSQDFHVTNVISLGITPWTIGGIWAQGHIDSGNFVNIFTDADFNALYTSGPSQNTEANAVKYNINCNISANELKGDNAMTKITELTAANKAKRDANGWPFFGANLDWNTQSNPNGIWYVGKEGDYPTLLKGYELSAANNTAAEWNLLGANIEYKNDGSYALNFHFVPTYENQDIELYVAKADTKNGFIKLDTYTTSPFASEFAGAKMFTINTLSARDIDTTWLATIITKAADGSEIVYGKTESISIAQVANAVVNGDAYYSDNATSEQKANDVKVAAALINYNESVKNISNEAPVSVVDTWDGKVDSNLTGDGTAQSPFIIDSAEKLAYIAINAGFDKTNGNYYKVADGISAFNMNTTGKDLSGDLTAEQVKSKLENEIVNAVWWSGAYFAGHFDGNGVTVYGLHSGNVTHISGTTFPNNAGLFPSVDGNATIKNVTVKNSYFKGGYAASVVGMAYQTNDSTYTITLENVAAVSNYVVCTSTNKSFGGIVFAYAQMNYLHVNGCLAANNVGVYSTTSITAEMPVISYANNGTSNIQNLISIGSSVHGNTWNFSRIGDGKVKNVYTDHSFDSLEALDANRNSAANRAKYNVVQLDTADLLGVAAMKNIATFDWENVWTYGAEGKPPVLAPRTNEDTAKKAVYWVTNTYDDDFIVHADQPGNGTEGNPYIIYDAEDLASVVAARVVKVLGADKSTATPIDTTGVYFKVADNIAAFYMAQDDPTYGSPDKWNTMEKVKAALSNKAGVYKWWVANEFKGHFDGNGATVYGLYSDKDDAGLFARIGAGSVIKNIAVKNSYFKTSGNAGAIVGQVRWYSSIGDSSHTFESCVSQNNYIEGTEAGAIIGHGRENKLIINNCLVAGNDFAGEKYLAGTSWCNSNTISNTVVIDGLVYGKGNQLKKSDIFTNVFTNTDQSGSGVAYTDAQVKVLTNAQMQGAAAKTNMPALAWDSIWFAGKNGEYPSFTKPSTMPNDMQAAYDSLALDNHDNYGDSTAEFGVYATSLTLKNNPYISFTFAFNGEYKQNPDVVVTFTAGSYTKTVTAAEMTNNEGAGRYHLYRLKDAPVKALCNGITVTASYGGNTYNLGTYSVEGFALEAQRANIINPCDYYVTRYEAAKALLFYSQMLKERYGA